MLHMLPGRETAGHLEEMGKGHAAEPRDCFVSKNPHQLTEAKTPEDGYDVHQNVAGKFL